jgi:hypothetical protein
MPFHWKPFVAQLQPTGCGITLLIPLSNWKSVITWLCCKKIGWEGTFSGNLLVNQAMNRESMSCRCKEGTVFWGIKWGRFANRKPEKMSPSGQISPAAQESKITPEPQDRAADMSW